jgi:hypothetical protein
MERHSIIKKKFCSFVLQYFIYSLMASLTQKLLRIKL